MAIETGMTNRIEMLVGDASLATAYGSGLVEVFATPAMVALMEQAASGCLAPLLAEGQVSVGTEISVSHTAATPPGMRVQATATVTAVEKEGRVVHFRVEAADETGPIGAGTHTRALVNKGRFTEKALERGK